MFVLIRLPIMSILQVNISLLKLVLLTYHIGVVLSKRNIHRTHGTVANFEKIFLNILNFSFNISRYYQLLEMLVGGHPQ